jgi:hypothetical protein
VRPGQGERVSNGDQAAAIRLLMAARELLTDTLASDAERKRLAHQIGRFINHEPVDVPLPTDGNGRIVGESDDQLAERRLSARRGRVEHDE